MKTLIIAPECELDVIADIIAAIGGDNLVNVVRGRVGMEDVLRAIELHKPEALHFAGHGTNADLMLSDGPLNVGVLQRALADMNDDKPRLAFLNACYTARTAAMIYDAGVSYVIGWVGEVPDQVAKTFATTFYASLRYNHDPELSFETAEATILRLYENDYVPLLINGRITKLERRIAEIASEMGRRNRQLQRYAIVLASLLLLVLLSLSSGIWISLLRFVH